ncbi:hypothetical protein V5F44_06545 [Xanthobacter sp. V2C-8]|uniref:hypothetical protein n=1 Tax=Xanthobacter albus TaxID=3119929 RepID=UPI003728FDC2
MALVFGKIALSKPFAEWQAVFLAHAAARRAAGIEDVMHAPVIGEQAVVYVVRTADPRAVHDMTFSPEARAVLEASGHVPGSERYLVCDEV